jgi:hypothetical protein
MDLSAALAIFVLVEFEQIFHGLPELPAPSDLPASNLHSRETSLAKWSIAPFT